MAVITSLASCSQTPASNGPDGAVDAPSTLDDGIRYALSFIALLRDGAHQVATVTGTNTLLGTVSTNPASYIAGQSFRFVAPNANTGAVTLNINSLGAKSVTKNGTTALAAGDIPAGAAVTVIYDGTQFQLQNVAQAASLAANGYQRLSSGLILQWGSAATDGSGVATLTFPVAFPNACLVSQVSPFGAGSFVATVSAQSTTSVQGTMFNSSTGTTQAGGTLRFLCIGY